MKTIADEKLIQEIQRRLDERNQALIETNKMMQELKEVNEKLKLSEKLKGQFLSNIRNEINNPLSSVIALSEIIIKKDFKDSNQRSEVADLIHSEACELEFQLNNIFVASELEAGKMLPNIAKSYLLPIINDVIESVQSRKICTSNRIKLETNITDQTIFMTDADKISMVVANLLSNAAKFSDVTEGIIFTAKIENSTLILKVMDKGCGIDDEQLDEIFDRFTQLDTGMTKVYKGHGLGLSISKALLDLIDATITLESKKDEGSTFTVTVPESQSDIGFDEVALMGNEELFEKEAEAEGIELF